jgi:hypothetical protein
MQGRRRWGGTAGQDNYVKHCGNNKKIIVIRFHYKQSSHILVIWIYELWRNDVVCSLIRGTNQPILDGINSAITVQNKKLRQINTIKKIFIK